ncbi:Hypothetical protein, putative [Bodo saltans]|uniref:Uncharacterized protein n=1 Tax=Bodo saltans TaxID=75058 RepID=A0A0S4JNG9_BODSA|nr:Hypothetical protein, putative [Bodo saltans]|eukprot:CUG91978.1 Hypothetical protein, putative [Bodo saltans]
MQPLTYPTPLRLLPDIHVTDRVVRELADALLLYESHSEDNSSSDLIVINGREWNMKRAPLRTCSELMTAALDALETTAAALQWGVSAQQHPHHPIDRRVACDVIANGSSLILTIIHCASKNVPSATQRNLSFSNMDSTHPSASPSLPPGEEDTNGDVEFQWKFVCALTLSQTLQSVHPAVVSSIAQFSSGQSISSNTAEAIEVGKQLLTAARSISRYLGTDLCYFHLLASNHRPSSRSGCCEIRAYPRQLPFGDSVIVTLSDPLELWARWIPNQLLRSDGDDSALATSEGGRLAILMLDAVRRWCHDLMDRSGQASDAEASTVSPNSDQDPQTSLLSVGAMNALSILYEHVAHIVGAHSNDPPRHGAAPKLLSGVVSGLPANVMEGFLSVWQRIIAHTSHHAVEVLHHHFSELDEQPQGNFSSPVATPRHQRVDRALDLSVDTGAVSTTNHHASMTAAATETIEVVAPVIDPRSIAENSAQSALAPFVGNNSSENRMLTEGEVKCVMEQFATHCEDKVREMQLRLATLEAHNANLAARVASNVVTARVLNVITTASCFSELLGDGSVTKSPSIASPLDTTSRAATQYLKETGLSRVPSAHSLSESIGKHWAADLVDKYFDAAAFEKRLHHEAQNTEGPCTSWSAAWTAVDCTIQAHIHSMTMTTTTRDTAGSTVLPSVPLHPDTIKSQQLRGTTPVVTSLAQDSVLMTPNDGTLGGGGGRGRSSSAKEVLSHDEQLAEQEAEVDRLMKEARTMTPRHRAVGGGALRTPRGTVVMMTPRTVDGSERFKMEEHVNTFVSPISEAGN